MPTRRSPSISHADEAYARVRGRITRGVLAPGSRFTARRVAAEIGLGLTPIREALIQLERERLVVTLPRRGYVVAPVTAGGVRDTLASWALLKPRIAALAVERASAETAARICAAVTPIPARRLSTPQEQAAVLHARSRGWGLMVAATGSDLLSDVHRMLDGHLLRALLLVVAAVDAGPPPPQPDWNQLFATRDPAAAATAATDELRIFMRNALRLLDGLPDDAELPDQTWPTGAPRAHGAVAGTPPSRADVAWNLLRTRIVRGELAPGTHLTERALSAGTGLGITPVREALARLDSERLVLTRPRAGYTVAPMTTRDVTEAIDLWTWVAPTIAELAVRHATDAQGREIVAAMTRSASDPGLAPFVTAESRGLGWRLASQAGGNRVLAELHALFEGVLMRLFVRLHRTPDSPTSRMPVEWGELFAGRDLVRTRQALNGYLEVLATVRGWAVDHLGDEA